MSESLDPRPIEPDQVGRTLATVLRARLTDHSWKQVERLIIGRRAFIGGELCVDPARRMTEGEIVEVRSHKAPRAEGAADGELVIRHLDDHVVVVEKAPGINTVRHPAERTWSTKRRRLSPTLEDLTSFEIARQVGRQSPRLRIVHRLDKETSGLVVFARTVVAERELGRQFASHTVTRRYLAVIRGYLSPRTIRSTLLRDRGDGRRGSTTQTTPTGGKEAITHVDVEERLNGYTILSCRLETGRTHQIRIHLAETGHPVCGERVYDRPIGGEPIPDRSRAPRLALHATELGFAHPIDGRPKHWEMPLPHDLITWLAPLRDSSSERT